MSTQVRDVQLRRRVLRKVDQAAMVTVAFPAVWNESQIADRLSDVYNEAADSDSIVWLDEPPKPRSGRDYDDEVDAELDHFVMFGASGRDISLQVDFGDDDEEDEDEDDLDDDDDDIEIDDEDDF